MKKSPNHSFQRTAACNRQTRANIASAGIQVNFPCALHRLQHRTYIVVLLELRKLHGWLALDGHAFNHSHCITVANDFFVLRQYGLLDHLPRFSIDRKCNISLTPLALRPIRK
jgi:hypothetical protein